MDGLADWGMIESWDMWMVSGGFQVLGSFNAPEMGQGACQLDGAQESGDGEFLPSGKYLVLGEVIKEWGFQRQPQG